MGFENFYGFIGAETNQWRPAVFDGTKPIEPYLGNPDYNFDYDMADQAIEWVRNQKAVAPDKPFFLYYAPGATHSPHHPKKEWIAKYKGKFDQGWDKVREETLARQKKLGIVPADTKLTERSPGIPAWDSLNAEQKQLYAYMMEIYAGYLSQTDYNVGRVLDAIEQTGPAGQHAGHLHLGDNGASGEGMLQGSYNEMAMMNRIPEDYKEVLKHKDDLGTWKTHNHYPVGWAHAMDTPFQWVKQIASHYGGTANGMVISWPARIKDQGGIRSQWHHVIDIVPTILDVTGIAAALHRQRGGAEAHRGREHGLHLRRCQSALNAPHAVFRDVRPPRHLSRRLGGLHHAALRRALGGPDQVRPGRCDQRLQVGALPRRG